MGLTSGRNYGTMGITLRSDRDKDVISEQCEGKMKFGNLFRMIYAFADAREIRKDEERRKSSVKYGIRAIVYAVFAIPFAFLIAVFPKWMSGGDTQLLFIFGIALFAIGIAGVLIFLLNATVFFFLQLSLNKRAVTWVALAFWLLSIAACAFIVVWALGLF